MLSCILTLTPPRLLQINGCGSVAAQINGDGGAGKRMRAVDGKQEITLEWPKLDFVTRLSRINSWQHHEDQSDDW